MSYKHTSRSCHLIDIWDTVLYLSLIFLDLDKNSELRSRVPESMYPSHAIQLPFKSVGGVKGRSHRVIVLL